MSYKNRQGEWSGAKVFFLALLTAAVIFLPAMIWDRGYFIFLGDFNSQQIPFYRVAHRAIRSGNMGWNWYTDLGVNFIGSYSFYLLGSPFFWLTVLFPESWISYFMGPLLILKFACAALTSYLWLKRHVRTRDFATLGGFLYAFSGFSIYNIFFNHFHEPMIFFPLLLIGIDELMDYGTKGVFAVTVCLNCVVSYFFFVGEVVFTVIYFFVRVFTKSYQFTWKRFLQLAFEAVLGMLLSMFLFWPSLLVMLSNYRVNNYADGFDLWIYGNTQRPYAILFSMLFPNELPSKQVLLPDASVRWTSLTAYLPMFGISGVLAFLKTHRKNWLKVLIPVLIVMAMVPALNSLFVAFNKAYYTRWFYMFTLMLILATVRVLDEERVRELEKSTVHLLILTSVLVLILALTPDKLKDGTWRIGIFSSDCPWQFALIVAFALIGPGVSLLLLDFLREDPKKYVSKAVLAVMIISMLYGNFYVIWGKTRSYDTHEYFIPDVLEGKWTIEDEEFFRIDSDDSVINIGMFWNVPDIRAFHSLVPASVFKFYDFIGDARGVKSVPEYEDYAIRSLFSVKYFVDSKDEGDDFQDSSQAEGTTYYTTEMPDYVPIHTINDYDIFLNKRFIPMGFTYDAYCTESEAEEISESSRGQLMLQMLILPDDTDPSITKLLRHDSNVVDRSYSEESYVAACLQRQKNACDSFVEEGDSFHASIYSDKENLVFFSVPYETGWSAKVNGQDAEIIQANVGFMAVKVPRGESKIEFTYETPGLRFGLIVSAAGVVILAVYMLAARLLGSRVKQRKKDLI